MGVIALPTREGRGLQKGRRFRQSWEIGEVMWGCIFQEVVVSVGELV